MVVACVPNSFNKSRMMQRGVCKCNEVEKNFRLRTYMRPNIRKERSSVLLIIIMLLQLIFCINSWKQRLIAVTYSAFSCIVICFLFAPAELTFFPKIYCTSFKYDMIYKNIDFLCSSGNQLVCF